MLLDEILPSMPQGNIVRSGGEAWRPDTLQRHVNRFFKSLDIDATFHKLRSRYVTQGIAETGDIYAVARAAGGASIETAQAYAALSDDALHRIAAAGARRKGSAKGKYGAYIRKKWWSLCFGVKRMICVMPQVLRWSYRLL